MATKNVLTQMMIDGVLQNIMLQTGADNVIVDAAKGEMLSTRLATIATSLANMNSSTEVDKKINTAINNLINGAPETYDTLKEIATKVEKSATNGSIKINGVETQVYSHPVTAGNKHIPAGGAAGQSLVYGGSSGTAAWGTAPTIVRSGATTPQDLHEGELFFKILN